MPDLPAGAFDPQSAPTDLGPVDVTAVVKAAGMWRGSFQIVRRHAQGGLGVVSVAHDAKLDRDVALKELRQDRAASTMLRQRFLTEATITGQLEHPGIVPIYALDEQDGQPFYAMRFIEGQTLHEAIRTYHGGPSPLALRDLLQRFVSVCQTIAYAHSRGVIHRDLKPANIMLGQFGETLVVDWGLAKKMVIGQRPAVSMATPSSASSSTGALTSGSDAVQTQDGAILGTPRYMSPEQAAGDIEGTGPAADIYSLGVILYELLAGRAPFEGNTFETILNQVREGVPIPPTRLQRDVPRALEAVCLKAMARDIGHRYTSAAELAAEVNRWSAGEPVTAWREPWWTRVGRWLRRHRTLVAGGVAALVVAVVALAALFVLVSRHNASLLAANERERFLADLGQETMEQLTDENALEYLQRLPALEGPQRTFLQQAATYYHRFASLAPANEAGRWRQAKAYFRIGSLQDYLGEKDKAEEAYRQALDLYDQLAVEFPAVAQYREELASIANNLGVLLNAVGKARAAEPVQRRALKMRTQLVEDFPTARQYREALAGSHNNLGLLLNDLGMHADAEASYRQALPIYEALVTESPDDVRYRQELATARHNLGNLLAVLGKRAEAEVAYRQALTSRTKLVADFPAAPQFRFQLARSHNNLAILLKESGRRAEAASEYRLALAQSEQLAAAFPAVPSYRQEVGKTQYNLGILLAESGQRAEAEAAFRHAATVLEKLTSEYPSMIAYRVELAASCVHLGHLYLRSGRAAECLDWSDKAVGLLEPIVAQGAHPPLAKVLLCNGHWGQAAALDQLGRASDAVRAWDRAIAVNDRSADSNWYRQQRALSLARAGEHARAVAEADALAEAKDVTANSFYDLACVCALSSAAVKNDAKLQDQYAARAVELLRQAVAKGYKDVEHLKKDEDLKPLRERDDYRKLLTELEETKQLRSSDGADVLARGIGHLSRQ